MIKVGIVGGTGYTGVELLRLLAQHPEANVEIITSRSEDGVSVAEMYPNLRGHYDNLRFSVPDVQKLGACDVVFFATPHGVAHSMAAELLLTGVKIIDLSADFRLRDPQEWSKWYNQPHGAPELLAEAVYGLPEVNREAIKLARLIAVPGCYPTATQLGFLPLLEAGIADTAHLIADCKSGRSGRQCALAILRGDREHESLWRGRSPAFAGNPSGPATGCRSAGWADFCAAFDAHDSRHSLLALCHRCRYQYQSSGLV